MKVKLLVVIIAAMLLGGAILYGQLAVPINIVGQHISVDDNNLLPFPAIDLKTTDGQVLRVNDMPEKIVLIHFWAAWCAVCYTEFPALLNYVEKAQGKIALVSISLDDRYQDSEKALRKIAQLNHFTINAPHLYWVWDQDKSLSLGSFNTVKVPETIVINEKRLMADKIVGVGPWEEATADK
jgi:thiol-disulfide isomerase/thioredoxin